MVHDYAVFLSATEPWGTKIDDGDIRWCLRPHAQPQNSPVKERVKTSRPFPGRRQNVCTKNKKYLPLLHAHLFGSELLNDIASSD